MAVLTRLSDPTHPSSSPAPRDATRLAVGAALGAGVLVAGTAGWGAYLQARGVDLHLSGGEPLTGRFRPRLPAATVLPVLTGLALLLIAPRAAGGWRWRRLLWGSWAGAAGWALALALVDGVHALAEPLTTRWEYLRDVPRVGGLREFLTGFTDHVLGGSPGFQWATHVSGHPPGALLAFVGLDRLGLGAPGWAAALCVAAGASAAPAVLMTARTLGGEPAARRAAPFVVLAPAALWIATSADALFCGVACWGVCALAAAAAHHGPRADAAALAGGLLLGALAFLSYGLVLVGILAATAVLAQRRARPLLVGAVAVAAVVAGFAALGFWWWDGFLTAAARVREGPAWIDRPAGYFRVADLAAVAICAGPAAVGGLALVGRDAWGSLRGQRVTAPTGTALGRAAVLPLAAAAAIVLAVGSNLAKGEVERIFLPLTIWLLVAAGGLAPRQRRRWLVAQLVLAMTVQLCWMLKW